MITPGRFLLSLLAAASVCVDVALAANLRNGEPSEAVFGCLLGLVVGQIGMIAAGWIRCPDRWPLWSLGMLGSIGLGSVLLATSEKIPLLHWVIVLGVFAMVCVALPMIYRVGRREAKSQFSLAAIFALTTAATLVCFVVLQSNFPWRELPVALPGLMVWSCPTMVVALTIAETKADRQRQLVIGLGAILAMSLTAAWMLPALWNRMPLVIAWESFYLLIAGIVAVQAIANDELMESQQTESPTISQL